MPHVVLHELDKLKGSKSSLSVTTTRAIRYINNKFKGDSGRFLGQSSQDNMKNLIDIVGPDDRILNCCLQLKAKQNEVLLLTNDINLGNKAMASSIQTSTSKEMLKKLKRKQ